MTKPKMSESGVRRSLAIHEKRLDTARRQLKYRHAKHAFYHEKSQRPAAERQKLATKWHNLEAEASQRVGREEYWVSRRRRELRWYQDNKRSPRANAVLRAQGFAKSGIVEKPAGSNSGPFITTWQTETARGATYLHGAPWCGIFCENVCRDTGVKTSPRWASVAFIEDDARAHCNGFRGWTTDPAAVLPGDLVVLFGRGVHVELVVKVDSGLVHTVGGNTSAGTTGSQSNGGGVFARVRSLYDVHGFALVDYPG